MNDPHVTLSPDENPVVEKLRGPLEEQLTSALRRAVDTVEDDYAGESVGQVTAELLENTKSGLHPDIAEGFAPDEGQLRAVAEAIVEENS